MTVSASISRTASTGMFSTMPPSASTRPLISTGVKTPGIAMLARTAVAQRTIVQHDAVAALHIRGHAAERDGQVVEAGDAGVGECDAIEQQADAVAGIESVGTVQAVLQAERGLDLVIAAILLAAIAQAGGSWARKAATLVPVNVLRQISGFPRATCPWHTWRR